MQSPHLELAHVNGGRQKLVVVDGARCVHIDALHQLLDLFLGDGAALLRQPFPQLVQRHGAALVHIKCLQSPVCQVILQP